MQNHPGNYRPVMNPMPAHPIQTPQTGGQQQQSATYANPAQHSVRPRGGQPQPRFQHYGGPVQAIYVTQPGQPVLSSSYYPVGAQHAMSVGTNMMPQAPYTFQPYNYYTQIRPQTTGYQTTYHPESRQQGQSGAVPFQAGVLPRYVHPHQQQPHPAMNQHQQQPQQSQTTQQQPQQAHPIHQTTNQPQIQPQTQHVPQMGMPTYTRVVENQGPAHRVMPGDQGQGQSMIPPASAGNKETGNTRRRRILEIKDPNTGRNILEDKETSETAPDTSKDEEKKTKEGETPEVSAASLSNSSSSNATGNGPTSGGSSDSGGSGGSSSGARETTPVSSSSVTDEVSSKAKLEFYSKISQAVDTPKPEDSKSAEEESTSAVSGGVAAAASVASTVSSTSTPVVVTTSAGGGDSNEAGSTVASDSSSSAAAGVTSPDPTPTTTTPRSSPTTDGEKTAEEVPATPAPAAQVAQAAAEEKTAVVTPESPAQTPAVAAVVESSSSSVVVVASAAGDSSTTNNVKNEDEEVDSINQKVEELVLTNGDEKLDEEDKDNVPSDSHDMSTTSISPVPIENYCDSSARSQDDSTVGELTNSLNEEEKESSPGQHAELNNVGGEDEEEEEEDVEEEDIEEGEILENGPPEEDGKDGEENEKKIRQYNREMLLRIGQESKGSKSKMEILVPEVVKDNNRNVNARPPMNQQGGYRGGPRGQPNRGGSMPSPFGMPPIGGRLGPAGGLGQWGSLVVPPPLRTNPPPHEIKLTKTPVTLHKAENAWKPTRQQQARTTGAPVPEEDSNKSEDEKQKDEIVKQTRGILNKLTPENFDRLLIKFLKLELNDREDRISAVIKVVFEKAVDEPSFAMWYAKMVYEVTVKSPETSRKFRKEILDQCQREFQKSNKDEDEITKAEEAIQKAAEEEKENLKLELEEKRTQMRRRSLGNVRFIGELYKLQMLTPKIMVDCVQMLLANQDEESLECLCKLLTTVGLKLDTQLKDIENRVKDLKARGQPLPKFVPEENYMDKTFKRLGQLSNEKKLSSRIRFALLDLVELRDNGWKPRRDANAPKTIDEVRREAARQEQEEKQKINALPEERGSRRPSPLNNAGPQQQKKGEWSTVQSNKSSRFQSVGQMKRTTDSASSPVLGPPTISWGQPPAMGRGQSSNSRSNIPPRLMAQQQQQQQQQQQGMLRPGGSNYNMAGANRFNQLSMQSESSGISSSSSGGSGGSTGGPPQLMPSSHRQRSPPPPSRSEPPPPQQREADEPSADVNETVKNIFEEFLSVQKVEDTLDWIKKRFRGDRVLEFVDTLARQVAEMSKENQQVGAGKLIKILIKQNLTRREQVLKTIREGVIPDLPDIEVDTPKVTTYFAIFMLELFGDESNLNWLVEIVEPLLEDFPDARENLIREALNLFKLKRNEQYVKSLWSQTHRKDSLLIESLPWLNDESRSSLVDKMIPVLKENEPNEIVNIFKENSWDLREAEISSALISAICEVCYQSGTWNSPKLEKLVPLLSKTPGTPVADLWKVAKEFIKHREIGKDAEEVLWRQLLDSGVVTTNNKGC